MSYIVLARKYRPQTFNEIYAQEHITQILSNSIKTNRLAHAYLFTGPRGVGKTSMARIFAKSLNCVTGPTVNPCNVCQNCLEITKTISNDVIEIDGASHNSVDDVRDLQTELIYTPTNSPYKIYIIDEVHMLSKSAFNALLKTLEEPPTNVVFIFATTEPTKVIPTILSRCQRFDFRRIPVEAITNRLKEICQWEGINVEDEALYLIARKSDGGMRDALSLLDQVLSYAEGKITLSMVQEVFGELPLDIYLGLFDCIVKHKSAEIIEQFRCILNRGIDLTDFVINFLEFLRQVLMIKLGVSLTGYVGEDIKKLREVTEITSQENIMYLMTMLIQLKQDLKLSSHPSILIEVILIKMTKLHEMEDLDKIIANLHEIPSFTNSLNKYELQSTSFLENNLPSNITLATDSTNIANQPHTDIDLLQIQTRWNEFTNIIKSYKNFVFTYLQKGKLVAFEKGKLTIMLENKIQLKTIEDERQYLNNALSNFFKSKITLQFIVSEQPQEKVKKIPTIQEIKETNPQLAKLIEISQAIIHPG